MKAPDESRLELHELPVRRIGRVAANGASLGRRCAAKLAMTMVPLPGEDSIAIAPSRSRTRSRIPSKPNPVVLVAGVKSIAVVADGQLDTVPFSTISITARLTIPSTVRLGLTYSCGHIGAAHWPVLLGVISTRDAPFPPVLEIVTSRAPLAVFALCQYSPTVFTVRPLASAWDGTEGVS